MQDIAGALSGPVSESSLALVPAKQRDADPLKLGMQVSPSNFPSTRSMPDLAILSVPGVITHLPSQKLGLKCKQGAPLALSRVLRQWVHAARGASKSCETTAKP